MKEIVVKIENLSKMYRLGTVGTGTLKDDIIRTVSKVIGRDDPYLKICENNERDKKGKSDLIWALKSIDLEIKRGERVGIIGKNGAGKSTLLKILSQVTGPTKGTVKMKGRVASLLEVGTGFHGELTGRENIYLNGTILGMSHREVSKKLDEIVDFAGVERYLDTPVKRYSSGMTVRLGFAVAAHLEPDILIVDEVLAVGDAEFQEKAIGKMKEVSYEQGRTILFVSHNMAAINNLCERGVLFKNGAIDFIGTATDSVSKYIAYTTEKSGYVFFDKKTFGRYGPRKFSSLKFIKTLNIENDICSSYIMGEKIHIVVGLEIFKMLPDIEVCVYFKNINGAIYGLYSSRIEKFNNFKLGFQEVKITLPENILLPGDWMLNVWVRSVKELQDDGVETALKVRILSNNNYNGLNIDFDIYKHYGFLNRSNWKLLS